MEIGVFYPYFHFGSYIISNVTIFFKFFLHCAINGSEVFLQTEAHRLGSFCFSLTKLDNDTDVNKPW